MNDQSAIITHEIVGFLWLIVALIAPALSGIVSHDQTVGLLEQTRRPNSRVKHFGRWSGFG
jgi:hypothetical protein